MLHALNAIAIKEAMPATVEKIPARTVGCNEKEDDTTLHKIQDLVELVEKILSGSKAVYSWRKAIRPRRTYGW